MTDYLRIGGLGLLVLAAAGAALADDAPPPPAAAPRKAVPVPVADPNLAAPPSAELALKPKLQPQSVVVTLISGATMSGTLSDADQWVMKTTFGTTNLPLSAVAGIRMAQEGSATTTVVLHNGDTITGAVEFDHVAIQTDWGRAEILGTHVASILFTSGLKWISEPGLNGTRWRLVAEEPRANTPAPVNPPAPAASAAAQPRAASAANRPVARRP